jgi:hypothetical protein
VELIAVDDVLPTVQWAKNFMKDQGYDLNTIIKENKKSTMLLMKNGRLSVGAYKTYRYLIFLFS